MKKKFPKFLVVGIACLAVLACGSSGSVTMSGGGTPQKVVFAGASTIAYWNPNYGAAVNLEKYGVVGRESAGLVNEIEGYVASGPDKVFVMIGANDVMNRHEGALVENITAIIEKIRKVSPQSRIYYIAMNPVNNATHCRLMEIYNDRLQNLCGQKSVTFLSLYNLFKDPTTIIKLNLYRSDGIHLNEDGYKIFSNSLKGSVLN
jgi:hypothetical protein